jgi:uroporphyrinogen III methyltransferase/synthase
MVSGDDRLLIPRSLSGSKVLNEILDETGISYDDIVLYEVAAAGVETENRAKALKHLDYLTFSSASGVEAFFKEADEEIKEALAGLNVVCIGDITAKSLMEHGRKADIIAGIYSIRGIAEAICRDWKAERKGVIQDENR